MIRAIFQTKLWNIMGIHLRAGAQLVQLVSRFRCKVIVTKEGRSADGRSLIQLLTLGAFYGSVLEFSAEGDDAPQAIEAIRGLLNEWKEQNGGSRDAGASDGRK